MRTHGENFDALAADLAAARGELLPLCGGEPDVWTRSKPGKWTGGQHLEHVAVVIERFASDLEAALDRMRKGTLPPPPGRDPFQALFVEIMVRRGMMPRGAKTSGWANPSASPERAAVAERLRRGVDRLVALGRGLTPRERDGLWILNPFVSVGWHYRLPETLRVQAVHFRHHGAQVRELARR